MVIGLCGYKGVGKTVVANHLINEHGFKPINFKDGLIKEMRENFKETLDALAENYDNLEGVHYNVDMLFQHKPDVMRALMQNYGTDVRRKDNNNYWVDIWNDTITNSTGNFVTDDVRFFNELDALQKLNGVLFRVTREDVQTGGSHLSETEQENFKEDFTLVGRRGEHESIYKQIDSAIEVIKSNHD